MPEIVVRLRWEEIVRMTLKYLKEQGIVLSRGLPHIRSIRNKNTDKQMDIVVEMVYEEEYEEKTQSGM